jgi:hypothetical protein
VWQVICTAHNSGDFGVFIVVKSIATLKASTCEISIAMLSDQTDGTFGSLLRWGHASSLSVTAPHAMQTKSTLEGISKLVRSFVDNQHAMAVTGLPGGCSAAATSCALKWSAESRV